MPSHPPPYEPELATLVSRPPDGDLWLHELKYDGYRFGCRIAGGEVELLSRNGKDWSDRFPDVVRAAAALPVASALLDGEVAVVQSDGRTDFHALQGARGSIRGLTYFAFDLLHLDSISLVREALEIRKERLRSLVEGADPMRYVDHVVGHGPAVFDAAKRLRTEGVVSKLRAAPHRSGRSPAWLKTKVVQRQEFVFGGYLASAGASLAAMLAGYYDDDDRLRYAGKVGTGFQSVERALLDALRARRVKSCPFHPESRPEGADLRNAIWVRPELVGEVEFLEWTPAQHFRHPSFKGLRFDKDPSTVRREHACWTG